MVFFRTDQQVDRSLGINIGKDNGGIIFKKNPGRSPFRNYFTKYAGHNCLYTLKSAPDKTFFGLSPSSDFSRNDDNLR